LGCNGDWVAQAAVVMPAAHVLVHVEGAFAVVGGLDLGHALVVVAGVPSFAAAVHASTFASSVRPPRTSLRASERRQPDDSEERHGAISNSNSITLPCAALARNSSSRSSARAGWFSRSAVAVRSSNPFARA